MPLYEYACNECGSSFEALVRGSETPACPSCGTAELTKKFSTFASSGGDAAGEGAPYMPSDHGHGHSCGPGCCTHY
ncbi:MAG: zinc ribbon domain-containing protein [Opitutales bacterium]